ncbi:MAG: glycosyltransferase [Patescibacteria group bacterium]|nr:glycosyltransferase [Patescibacteria group bacterium]
MAGRPVVEVGKAPPTIAPVARGIPRPRWSVMIPTYNCAVYLRETLQSVLAQDPGAEQMQIEVVDDVSTRDDPEAVVRELGQGRVAYFRQPNNQGAIGNFNTCIQRSRGHLVHILHGDDFVAEGFYSTLENLADRHPHAMVLATRALWIDKHGRRKSISPRVREYEQFSRDASPCYYTNPFATPAVVIRRQFYERSGGFLPGLKHTADWEMWSRSVAEGGVVMSNRVLAHYRFFDGNDTSRLMRLGENLREYLRVGTCLAARFSGFDIDHFRAMVCVNASLQAFRFTMAGDAEAAAAAREVENELRRGPMPAGWRLKHRILSTPGLRRIALAVLERWNRVRG